MPGSIPANDPLADTAKEASSKTEEERGTKDHQETKGGYTERGHNDWKRKRSRGYDGKEKNREGQKGLHRVFIDLEKAYDRVPRTETVSPKQFRRLAPWDLMFADDVALNGETNEDVEERLEQWRRALEDRGMKVSRQKTEYLCMGDQDPERAVEMQGVKLNRVQEFKYLGSTVQSDGASDKEVGKRIQAGWNAWRKITGLLCDRRVPAKLKGVMLLPEMLYGMEAVAVTKGQERKMEVAEMRMLRFSLGKTRLDRVRNSTIRQLGQANWRRS
ncbi:uncharacterized protein LOC125035913 [Penaeus chinensis]|uniref:uncharacterized protein LOC125035913 n=1 Tax=Penaeus chinensis TaxID=139456 RepID=UPI001FB77FD8|nr:uncharacterized protein LOC125035913 [Penaeus chinensis]